MNKYMYNHNNYLSGKNMTKTANFFTKNGPNVKRKMNEKTIARNVFAICLKLFK